MKCITPFHCATRSRWILRCCLLSVEYIGTSRDQHGDRSASLPASGSATGIRLAGLLIRLIRLILFQAGGFARLWGSAGQQRMMTDPGPLDLLGPVSLEPDGVAVRCLGSLITV